MTYPAYFDIGRGLARGWSKVDIFGRNPVVGTSLVPVTNGGVFRTPLATAALPLRIRAGNLNDDAAGTGAREVTLEYLNTAGEFIREALVTAGAVASAETSVAVLRLLRAYVSASGTYATATAGSHAADIVIEDTGGVAWATIQGNGFPRSTTAIGVYSVPLGYRAYLTDFTGTSDANKPVNLLFFKRPNILEVAAPFSAMELVEEFNGLAGFNTHEHPTAFEFPALTDLGCMSAVATGDADVSVTYTLLLERTDT